MYEISYTGIFKKDVKKIKKRNYDINLLKEALKILKETGTLPADKYKTHILKGNYKGKYEAHIKPDWLIVWDKKENIIQLARTGTHRDIFRNY